jgi:hypothetical protein
MPSTVYAQRLGCLVHYKRIGSGPDAGDSMEQDSRFQFHRPGNNNNYTRPKILNASPERPESLRYIIWTCCENDGVMCLAPQSCVELPSPRSRKKLGT